MSVFEVAGIVRQFLRTLPQAEQGRLDIGYREKKEQAAAGTSSGDPNTANKAFWNVH
ncbi:MAG: hypothetical protein LAT62_12505 [Natronospirillum sp.]|uniref:hypothetical protein n=1 Tax=Natronospirillum sp. TaxID=2812955 RepID=UPI0025DA9B93|nr:hypothetical protein [Natronospirillum sp.]MCH8552751.1 hypothetical protein [Natronospirillum sp.]